MGRADSERVKDREMREGLVLVRRKAAHQALSPSSLDTPSRSFSSLVGSVLRNNVLKAVGPLAFLWEVPGPPRSQRKQPLLQPNWSATNSEKQEF